MHRAAADQARARLTLKICMTEQTRYRVTGSIFLIALAVIFLPMLFDGAPTVPSPRTQTPPPMPVPEPGDSKVPAYDDVVPDSDVVARVERLKAEVDEDGFSTDTGTRFGEPVLTAVDETTAVWAVQAATFASFENAANFRESLRTSGFEAFISTVKESDAGAVVLYRVAVGPYLSHNDVSAAAELIGERFSVTPQVVAMSQ